MILDLADAFMGIPLAAPEQPFNCCASDFPVVRSRPSAYHGEPEQGRFILWAVLGFGGKPNPLVFARVASFAVRCAQAMLRPSPSEPGSSDVSVGRLQCYVDDPIGSFLGSRESTSRAADLVIAFWLILGLPLAWKKGTWTAAEHTWIGGLFSVRPVGPRVAGVVGVPTQFAADLFDQLAVLAKGRGHVSTNALERLLGKCGRLSFLVPSCRPFVSSLWGAFAASRSTGKGKRREAPPGRHACRRFASGAQWLRTLLRPPVPSETLLPLEHLVIDAIEPIKLGTATAEVDASPWGGGAVLKMGGKPVSFIQCTWTSSLAAHLGTSLGKSDGQTTWEYLMMLISLVCWASHHTREGLIVMGDNLAALGGILNLRGKSKLAAVTREVAWRRVRFGWRYAVAHLPAEHNLEADALSRVAAPAGSEQKVFPASLHGVPECVAPAFADLWVCGRLDV